MVKRPVQGLTPEGAFVFLERACTYDFRREDAIERDEALCSIRDLDEWLSCGLPRECPERRGRGGRRGDFA